jgi:hypothetical protein
MSNKEINVEKKQQNKYLIDDKKKLRDKILKLSNYKDRSHIINISKIIINNTDNYTNNSNGIFAFFHDLTDDIYTFIDDYIIQVEKERSKILIKNLTSDFADTIVDSDKLINKVSENNYNIEIDTEKYLTNKEKLIMRRKNYEKYLEKNQQ